MDPTTEEEDELRCYLCYLDEHGTADMTTTSSLSPLRKVVSRRVVNSADPHEVCKLACGHSII